MQPVELVTVNVKLPAGSEEIVAAVPVPVKDAPSGILVIVQVPSDGNPFKTTLPVDIMQVGCVIVPMTGADGEDDDVGITTSADAGDIHPAELVTVKLNVPEGSAETIVLIPLPVVVMLPGVRVNVQVPVEGSPLNWTLPVAAEHVEGVTDPTTGACVTGCGFMIALPDKAEEQLFGMVTVNV
jgi:hypothetical protein